MNPLVAKADAYMRHLCLEIPGRQVGSPGNRAATDRFAHVAASCGFETQMAAFACMDWSAGGVQLTVNGAPFAAFVSPYSLGCQVEAGLVAVSTLAELETADIAGQAVLLRGDLAREQLMPKNFPFYNPDHHQRIIQLLEAKRPAAIIAATTRDAAMVGSLYPFPLIEDGDFDIPSVYMTEAEGNRLAAHTGQMLSLTSRASRVAAKAVNVIARKGAGQDLRVVLCAHIDAKMGTPGALDNAGGVTVLLLLMELLADYSGRLGIELVAMNGEDYYSNPGEQQYLAANEGRFDEILVGINLDGVGDRAGKVAYSLYNCPDRLASSIRQVFSSSAELVVGDPWYQGDHGLFLMNRRPAVAITSERAMALMGEIIHTPNDLPELVDTTKLVHVAGALRDLLMHLDQQLR